MRKNRWRRLCYPQCTPSARQRTINVLKTPRWKTGQRVPALAARIAKRLDVPYEWVILTNSCTSALAAAHQFSPNTHRFPLLTYSATFAHPQMLGRPVELVDVDEDGWALKSPTTQVDLWGRAAPGPPPAVLDAAHRFAAPEHSAHIANGTAVCYSFGPMKEVAAPEGGALVWKRLGEPEFREQVVAFLNYGQSDRVPTMSGGINGYMNEVTAATLLAQEPRHEALQRMRQDVLAVYENFLGDYLVTKPGEASGHLAVVRLPDAGWAKLAKARLQNMSVQWGLHYPIGEEFAETHAYDLSQRIISLPCHHMMLPAHAGRLSRILLTVA